MISLKTCCKLITLAVLCVFLYSGCNSAIYEIIEVEEPVEIKPEKTEVADIKEDIKEEVKEEPKEEPKYTEEQLVSKTFAIQIGAFNRERNATNFTKKARRNLTDYEIYCKDIDGQYKVRLTNTFKTVEEATPLLETLQARGFTDSFILELKYYKVENN